MYFNLHILLFLAVFYLLLCVCTCVCVCDVIVACLFLGSMSICVVLFKTLDTWLFVVNLQWTLLSNNIEMNIACAMIAILPMCVFVFVENASSHVLLQ